MSKRQKTNNDNSSNNAIDLESDTCYVKHIDDVKGFGIFAKKDLQTNELVLHEIPLIQVQRTDCEKIMKLCSHCMKFIGSLKIQFELLLNGCNPKSVDEDTLNNLPLLDQCSSSLPSIVKCQNCDEVYCSTECLTNAWNQYHKAICCKLEYFTKFVTENHLDLCVLAARVYGSVLQQYESTGNFDEAWKPFSRFSQESWTKIVHSAECDDETTEIEKKVHNAFFLFKNEMLRDKPSDDETINKMFTFEFFDAVLGMMQYNVTDTAVCSPVWEYADRIQDQIPNLSTIFQGEERKLAFERLEKLATMIKEIQRVREDNFTLAKGAALFRFHHYFNHSCDPNARNGVSSWKEGVHEASATIRCLRPIAKDEEICISYMGGKLPFKERREMLRGLYGFMCKCSKCTSSPEYKGE